MATGPGLGRRFSAAAHYPDHMAATTRDDLLAQLRAHASERHRRSVARLGIPEEASIGVSVSDVRRIARSAGRSDELARELWKTGIHEARLLAALLFDPRTVSSDEARRLIGDVVSWDLCDHLCGALFLRMDGYERLIHDWGDAPKTYTRRAAYALIATAATHERAIAPETITEYLELIAQHADDARTHVKKAVSWALRELGQRDLATRDRAIVLARELAGSDSRTRAWIGRTALKELETLVEVPGRRRLVSATSKAARDFAAAQGA